MSSVLDSNETVTISASTIQDGALIQNGSQDGCAGGAPTAKEVIDSLADEPGSLALVVILCICTLVVSIIFIEEVFFISKTFHREPWKAKRILYILCVYPILSFTALMGVMVPRSATLVDLISNGYLATCLYVMARLVTVFMGGIDVMQRTLDQHNAVISLRSPPCCCCCFCLPTVRASKRTLVVLYLLVLQVCIVRPLLMFIAAVAWADGNYVPGMNSASSASTYITVINLVSTLFAVYGLLLKRNLVAPYLVDLAITGKIMTFQLTMVSTVVPDLIIGIIAAQGLLPCTPLFPTEAHSARLQHTIQVFLTFLLALLARYFFRRKQDATLKPVIPETMATENAPMKDSAIPVEETRNGDQETWDILPTPVSENAAPFSNADEDRQPINA